MNSNKKLAAALGFMITLLAVSLSAAGIMGHDFGQHEMGPGFMAVKTLMELRLTDAQQTQVLNTFTKYQNEIQNLQERLYQGHEKATSGNLRR